MGGRWRWQSFVGVFSRSNPRPVPGVSPCFSVAPREKKRSGEPLQKFVGWDNLHPLWGMENNNIIMWMFAKTKKQNFEPTSKELAVCQPHIAKEPSHSPIFFLDAPRPIRLVIWLDQTYNDTVASTTRSLDPTTSSSPHNHGIVDGGHIHGTPPPTITGHYWNGCGWTGYAEFDLSGRFGAGGTLVGRTTLLQGHRGHLVGLSLLCHPNTPHGNGRSTGNLCHCSCGRGSGLVAGRSGS